METKKKIGTIDATPTWANVVEHYINVLENPKVAPSHKKIAREEIRRLANIADSKPVKAATELLAACKVLLAEHTHMNKRLIELSQGVCDDSISPAGMARAAIAKATN